MHSQKSYIAVTASIIITQIIAFRKNRDIHAIWTEIGGRQIAFAVLQKGGKMNDLINRKGAINAVCTVLYPDADKMNDAKKVLKEMPPAQPEQKWIPCSDMLPKEPGLYLVSGGSKTWFCEFCKIFEVSGWINSARNPEVKAWMELPDPYEGEQE